MLVKNLTSRSFDQFSVDSLSLGSRNILEGSNKYNNTATVSKEPKRITAYLSNKKLRFEKLISVLVSPTPQESFRIPVGDRFQRLRWQQLAGFL